MSGDGQSEEKTLQASDKKLREARKKGQVAQSKDMVIGTGTVAILAYVWFAWDGIQTRLIALLTLPANSYDLAFLQAVRQVVSQAFHLAVMIVLPLIVIVILVSLLTHIAVMQGIVISTEPIKPKSEKINPVSGFKRLFSLKNLVEFVKSTAKTILLAGVAMILAWLGIETLLKGPACGPACVAASFGSLTKPLFIAFALIFFLFGILDIGLQRWLFLRDQRMTKSEVKRERKDIEGDPDLRRELARQRRELTEGGSVPTGIKHATILIADGEAAVVGIRYIKGETPIPALVCKGRHDRAVQLITSAHQHHIPIVDNPALAQALAKTGRLGDYVDSTHFHAIALVLPGPG